MAETTSTKSPASKSAEQLNRHPHELARQPALLGPYAQILTLQRTVGNRAVSQLLQSANGATPMIQPKLTISRPGDKYEQEADRIAEIVTQSKGQIDASLSTGPQHIQRKCAACESSRGPCPKCAEEEIQLKPLTSTPTPLIQHESSGEEDEGAPPQTKDTPGQTPPVTADVQARILSLRSGGQHLPSATRAFFESRFHYNFSHVRIHTGAQAAEAARAVNARAFTLGRDMVFGSGQYAPESNEGQQLLAHELTHVVQQTSPLSPTTSTVQRQPTSRGAATDRDEAVTTPGLIVEDTATELKSGQMKKSEFLAELRTEVCNTAKAALAGTGQTTDDCPYLNFWFDYYSQKDNQHIERAIRKYAPETSGTTAAREYIPLITARVRRGVEVWARTGEITGVPEGVSADSPGANGAGNGQASASPTGNILFKGRDSGVREGSSPQAVQARLGDGRPLDSGVRSRMESAFGTSFSHVRVHTDANAMALSNRFNARAFTVGEHVAFGSGEYRPGTLIGDAIMAHELAHVAQQEDVSPDISPKTDKGLAYNSLEEDADLSAVGAVVSLWGKAKGRLKELARKVKPRLRSGLRLQRCSSRDCPSGYFWAAQGAIGSGIGGAVCKWRCVKSSSRGYHAANQPRPISLPEQTTGGMVTNDGDCICFAPEDEDGNKYTADQKVDCAVAQGGRRRGGRGGRAGVQGGGGRSGSNKPTTTGGRPPGGGGTVPPPGGGSGTAPTTAKPPAGGGSGTPPPSGSGGTSPPTPAPPTPAPTTPARTTPAPAGTTPAAPGTTPAPSAPHGTRSYNVSPARRTHILEGDPGRPGSGHGPRRGNTRGAFPDTWTDDQAIAALEKVANSPSSTWKQTTGPGYATAPITRGGPAPGSPSVTSLGTPVRFEVRGRDHGLDISVIVEPGAGGSGIVTGYVRE